MVPKKAAQASVAVRPDALKDEIEELGIETKEWDDLIAEIGDYNATRAPARVAKEKDEEEEVEEKPQPQKGKARAKANTKAKAEPAPKSKAQPSASSCEFTLSGKTVLITGTIPGHDRKNAQAIVEKHGANVAKSLNRSVELAILGTNAGPDKLKKIEDDGIETIQWNDMAEKLGLEITAEKEMAKVETSDPPHSIEGLTVIITGTIEGQTRSSAQKLLETAGATFAKSLNKQVELVVLGVNPGPDKLNKIAELGIPTCAFEALVEKLGLQAEAREPAKKKSKKN